MRHFLFPHELGHDPVLLKALLVHSAEWPRGAVAVFERSIKDEWNKATFKDHLSAYFGYGTLHGERVLACTRDRITLLGGGIIASGERHIHKLPLPITLNAFTGMRRLTVTAAWFSPIAPTSRRYRCAALSVGWPVADATPLRVDSTNVDGRAVGRGTTIHGVLERERGAINVTADQSIELPVTCTFEPEAQDAPVPYGLAISLEVAPTLAVSIYDEVRALVRPAVRIPVRPR